MFLFSNIFLLKPLYKLMSIFIVSTKNTTISVFSSIGIIGVIDKTIKEFDEVVEKIQHKDFSGRAKDKNLCANCDMRHYCRRKGDC